MKIREGAYYRTRNGDVLGPVVQSSDKKYPWTVFGGTYSSLRWTQEGDYSYTGPNFLDLISEVYISDMPQVDTTKTEKDELVEKAALAILAGREANPRPSFHYGMEDIWLAAKRFVEDGKK